MRMERQMNNWEKYRANASKAARGENYRAWSGGKGDIDRSSHTPSYKLGVELIRIAEEYGKDSKEYRKAEKEWRNSFKRK